MKSTDERESFDAAAGTEVRNLRLKHEMSQAELATKMTEQGVSTHPQTVLKIEQGKRPLRLAEAVALADIFGESLDRLFRPLGGGTIGHVLGIYEDVMTAADAARAAMTEVETAHTAISSLIRITAQLDLSVRDQGNQAS